MEHAYIFYDILIICLKSISKQYFLVFELPFFIIEWHAKNKQFILRVPKFFYCSIVLDFNLKNSCLI